MIEPVAANHRRRANLDGSEVEDLVTDALVGPADLVVDGAVLAHHHYIVDGQMLPEALGLKLLSFTLQQEGPGGRQFPGEIVTSQTEGHYLPADTGHLVFQVV